jgi:hypothetical protein
MTATMIVPETTWTYPFLKAYGAELKDSKKSGKNVKVVVVKNMKQFEDYVVNHLDNTTNRAIIKIKRSEFNEKYYKENIDNNFWNIKVEKVWDEGEYRCFKISGSKFKETNEGFKKVMAEYDRKIKELDRKDKELDRSIAYYNGMNNLLNIIIEAV